MLITMPLTEHKQIVVPVSTKGFSARCTQAFCQPPVNVLVAAADVEGCPVFQSDSRSRFGGLHHAILRAHVPLPEVNGLEANTKGVRSFVSQRHLETPEDIWGHFAQLAHGTVLGSADNSANDIAIEGGDCQPMPRRPDGGGAVGTARQNSRREGGGGKGEAIASEVAVHSCATPPYLHGNSVPAVVIIVHVVDADEGRKSREGSGDLGEDGMHTLPGWDLTYGRNNPEASVGSALCKRQEHETH